MARLPISTPLTPPEPRIARVAAQIAEPTRARMLAYLLSGNWASAGELARAGSVSPATASGHLGQLLDEGFVVCEPRGRHRYYRLAGDDIARALEALALVAERSTHTEAWASPARQRLRQARSCYRHLAGGLGVALFQGMLQRGWLQTQPSGYALTQAGQKWLREIGLDAAGWAPAAANGRIAYACLDWSERRDHLGGRLANALLAHFLDQRWLRRRAGERALELTPAGQAVLGALTSVTPPPSA